MKDILNFMFILDISQTPNIKLVLQVTNTYYYENLNVKIKKIN